MKKLLVILSVIFVFASISFAQTIKIKPKKIVYTRKGKQISKEKKTFVVTYPVISGAIPAATKKKLENTISYWRVFETTLKENLSESDWLTDLGYKVNFNRNGILDISLTQEGVGAYPDQQTVDLVINLKTGEQVKFGDVFKSGVSGRLANLVDKKLAIEKAKIIRQIDQNQFGEQSAEEKTASKQQVNDLKFAAENFNEFSVSDKGATILYDAGFPHVIQALEPEGRYFFTWAQLKPFIRPDGLLAQFVR